MGYKSVETSSDGRKVYQLHDIRPACIFPVEVCDGDGNPLPDVRFKYTADGANTSADKTDSGGVLHVKSKTSPATVTLTLE